MRGDSEDMRGDSEDMRGDSEDMRGDSEDMRGDSEDMRGDSDSEKMKWECLYQNHHNIRQTDGRMILYNLWQKKLNQEQEQRLVY
jgi:hypothetical protein